MNSTSLNGPGETCWMPKDELAQLIELLRQQGYQVMGPTVSESAIVYAEIESLHDLPRGYRDDQSAGKYRVAPANHQNYFEFNLGPQSWKQFLFPAQVSVARSTRTSEGWDFKSGDELMDAPAKYAFLGVRACELAAIAIQDRVFLQGQYIDPIYQQRRATTFIVAVNCTVAAATCFCTSMGTGPRCQRHDGSQAPFDIALTELEEGWHVELGSERGAALAAQLKTQPSTSDVSQEAIDKQQRAVSQIRKHLEAEGVRELLLENLDHPHWDDVAQRCLSCTNCTMVCPTCFCSSVKEVSDLSGDNIDRQREWDSCFNIDFGYTAGGIVRNDRRSRFRQWLTHKLASWHDQFDSSGCVGCGRCITWCPVGIDLTEEVTAIRLSPARPRTRGGSSPAKDVCQVKEEDCQEKESDA